MLAHTPVNLNTSVLSPGNHRYVSEVTGIAMTAGTDAQVYPLGKSRGWGIISLVNVSLAFLF